VLHTPPNASALTNAKKEIKSKMTPQEIISAPNENEELTKE
jgi:hypothetical protein